MKSAVSLDLVDVSIQKDGNAGVAAFGFEHVENVAGRAVAEKLAQSFFMIGDAMLFYESDEVGGSVAGQG